MVSHVLEPEVCTESLGEDAEEERNEAEGSRHEAKEGSLFMMLCERSCFYGHASPCAILVDSIA